MAEILYPNFLEDEQVYYSAEQHWRELFEHLLEDYGYSYRPFMDNTLGDGSPLLDGNPIFNAYVPEAERALRIIQEPPGEEASMEHWLHRSEWPDGRPMLQLVISLVLSPETERRALALLRRWLNGEEAEAFEQG